MSDDATRSHVPAACGDPECEAMCAPSGDGYKRCAAHATPDRVAELVAERDAAKAAVDESIRVHQANIKRLLAAAAALQDYRNEAT